jgi:hypothetical protein
MQQSIQEQTQKMFGGFAAQPSASAGAEKKK